MAGTTILKGEEDVPMSDINVMPLTDVMLVLLIIFLITIPVVLQTVPVKLPDVRYRADDDEAGKRLIFRSRRPWRHVRGLLGPSEGYAAELLDQAVEKLKS